MYVTQLDNIAINAIAVWLIQHIKISKSSVFSWINTNTPGMSRAVSVFAAAATSAGVSCSFQSSGGVLTIAGLSWMTLSTFLWYAAKNYAFQHAIYKSSYGMEQSLQEALRTTDKPSKT